MYQRYFLFFSCTSITILSLHKTHAAEKPTALCRIKKNLPFSQNLILHRKYPKASTKKLYSTLKMEPSKKYLINLAVIEKITHAGQTVALEDKAVYIVSQKEIEKI